MVVWRKIIQGEAKPGTFELFTRPHELCVSSSVLQEFENDRSAGQQLHTHADQGVASTVDEKPLVRGARDHRQAAVDCLVCSVLKIAGEYVNPVGAKQQFVTVKAHFPIEDSLSAEEPMLAGFWRSHEN
jgi:hypothetical protein